MPCQTGQRNGDIMEEREKALLSGQFIETLLQVPVSACPNRLKEIEECLRSYRASDSTRA